MNETETSNQHFLSILASAPPTFCIVQVPTKSSLKGAVSDKPPLHGIRFRLTLQVPNEANATFASRQNDDSNYTVYTDDLYLRFSHRSELYYLIISRLRQWQDGPLNQDLEPETARPKAPSSGMRLLSLGNPTTSLAKPLSLTCTDGGGVRGLCSLLVLEKLMYEVKKLELVDNPETRDWPRLPCRYFDLCGGTSTGGYVLQCQDKEIFNANNVVLLQSSFFVW